MQVTNMWQKDYKYLIHPPSSYVANVQPESVKICSQLKLVALNFCCCSTDIWHLETASNW